MSMVFMFQYWPRLPSESASPVMGALFSADPLLPNTIPGSPNEWIRYVEASSKPAYADRLMSKRDAFLPFTFATSAMTSVPSLETAIAWDGLLAGTSMPPSIFHNCASSEPLSSPSATCPSATRSAIPDTGLIIRQLPDSSDIFHNCDGSPSECDASPNVPPGVQPMAFPDASCGMMEYKAPFSKPTLANPETESSNITATANNGIGLD